MHATRPHGRRRPIVECYRGRRGHVSFTDALHGWGLTPGNAAVVQTNDGGQSWTTRSQPCQDPFTTPVTLAADLSVGVWVVCTDGSTNLTSVGISVMVSENGGRTW